MVDWEKVETLRKAKGWSQEQAASRSELGGGRQQWNNLVNGRQEGITLATLEKIANALGVKAKSLMK